MSGAEDRGSSLERVLRERTDVFERSRSILALAPGPDIERLLERLPHCRRVSAPTAAAAPAEAETFDLAIAGAGLFERGTRALLGELTRLLRPGGCLVASLETERAAECVRRLADAGYFVARAAEDPGSTVLLAVRGEFAAYAG